MKYILILLLLLASNVLIAQIEIEISPPPPNPPSTHLEPVEDFFSLFDFQLEYYIRLKKILFNELSDRPEIRFLIIPSFSPESVVEIQHNKQVDKYYSVYHIAEKMVWFNKKWEKVKVNKYQKEISKESVELFKSLFEAAIKDARIPEWNNSGLDGTTYFFSYSDWELRTAYIWTPHEGSSLGYLKIIGERLIDLTKGNDKIINIDGDFETEIIDLISRFKKITLR